MRKGVGLCGCQHTQLLAGLAKSRVGTARLLTSACGLPISLRTSSPRNGLVAHPPVVINNLASTVKLTTEVAENVGQLMQACGQSASWTCLIVADALELKAYVAKKRALRKHVKWHRST